MLLGLAPACANGGSAGGDTGGDDEGGIPPGDASADGVKSDAHPGDAKTDSPGSGTTAQKACGDNATAYCAQLKTCTNSWLVTLQYGDDSTCYTQNLVGCMDALAAPGTGWTGDGLEACIAARTALSCSDFLYGKPAPKACRVTGSITTSNVCRYGAQCGTGYCRALNGAACGNCVTPGLTGGPCTTSSDCDGNLMCAGNGTCQPPAGLNAACGATMPCQGGLVCIAGSCVAPGAVGATCAAANNGADCDYNQGAYCDTTGGLCASYVPAQAGSACSATAVCVGSATCFSGTCVAPVADQQACNPSQGQNCLPPDTCNAAETCSYVTALQCLGDGG
ncbi:MAG TPA: hypothetical protein VGG39_36560 [Polyangiaceae bacterium]|jgi:hypothetical protein